MCQWRLVCLIFLICMLSKLVHTAAAGFLALRDERRGTTSYHLPQTQHHTLAVPALHQCVPGMVVVVLLAFYSFDNGQISIRIPGSKSHSPPVCPLKDRHLDHSQSSIMGVRSQKVRFSYPMVWEVSGFWKYPGTVVLGSVQSSWLVWKSFPLWWPDILVLSCRFACR